MSIHFEQRGSDSPFVETIMYGGMLSDGTTIRPAESRMHLVFVKLFGQTHTFVAGPQTSSATLKYLGGAEAIWVQLKLGTYIPHLPLKKLLDAETELPDAGSRKFWLYGAAWELPTLENIETMMSRLARQGIVARDPVVDAALLGHPLDVPERTLRHRFLRITGQTQTQIRQIERAKQAAEMLRQGVSILDTVFDAGYFDQPHLTRALKQWIGYTPAQLLRLGQP